MSPEVQPPPDPRALLAVLEAQRRSESAARADLASAARDIARTRDVDDLQVRRAADAYSDALEGFTRPNASTAYVFAALYAMRRRVARWIGIPFVLLAVVAAVLWGYGAFEKAQRVALLRVNARTNLKAAHQKFEEAAALFEELDRLVRAERPAPPNLKTLQSRLSDLQDRKSHLRSEFERLDFVTDRDEHTVRRLRARVQAMRGVIEEFETELDRTRDLFLKGRELLRVRGRLDAALAEAQSLSPPPPLSDARAIHQRGVAALAGDDLEAASASAAALASWVKEEREAAGIPPQLTALLAEVKELTTDAEVLSKAAALHRHGKWAIERSERLQANESVLQLRQMVNDLSEEYTLVITGGKWRYRNNDASARTYYVIVEAVDPRGAKLAKHIRNEEDGSAATVRQWGERVPFAVYERVRKDKQDNGRIDQDVFGRKPRGRLEVEVEMRTDEGEILPRAGQITRW